jgi:hypothetical protein
VLDAYELHNSLIASAVYWDCGRIAMTLLSTPPDNAAVISRRF